MAVLGAALLAIAYSWLTRPVDIQPNDRLQIGNNDLTLERGAYELWWQQPARTPPRAEFSDFTFELVDPDGAVVRVRDSDFYRVVEANDRA